MTNMPVSQLPIGKTIADVYSITARNSAQLLGFAWPWLLVLIGVSAMLYWSLYPAEKASIAEGGTGSYLLLLLTMLASTAIGAAIAVPWHRTILLGEPQSRASGLALTPEKVAYAWKAILLIIAMAAPMWIIFAISAGLEAALVPPSKTDSPLPFFLILAAGIAVLIWLALNNRVWLVLPATAIGRHDIGIGQAWRATQRNTWRMMIASLIPTILPYIVLGLAINSIWPQTMTAIVADDVSSRAAFTAAHVATELVAMLIGMLFVTFLSVAYRHFFGAPNDAPIVPNDAP